MPLPAWDAEDVDESGGQGNHGGRKAQLTLWWTLGLSEKGAEGQKVQKSKLVTFFLL